MSISWVAGSGGFAKFPDNSGDESTSRVYSHMTIKQFKGSSGIQEFWSFLADESPRGLAVVVAAYFDERLGTLLSRPKDTFYSRIELGFEKYILTMNERDDLHTIRKLRNGFAHNLRDRDFDGDNSKQIDAMKTWQVAVTGLPQYAEIFPDARQRLLYVAGCFYVRLNQRSVPTRDPLPEPPLHNTSSWPLVIG